MFWFSCVSVLLFHSLGSTEQGSPMKPKPAGARRGRRRLGSTGGSTRSTVFEDTTSGGEDVPPEMKSPPRSRQRVVGVSAGGNLMSSAEEIVGGSDGGSSNATKGGKSSAGSPKKVSDGAKDVGAKGTAGAVSGLGGMPCLGVGRRRWMWDLFPCPRLKTLR